MRRSAVEIRSYTYAPLQYVGESHDHRNEADLVLLYHTTRLISRGVEPNAMSKALAQAVMKGDLRWQRGN
jgi:hypothetical protein